jgi:hypothetical protein
MADETPVTPAVEKPNHHVAFVSDLKERIAARNPEVRELLLTDLSTEEILRRKNSLKTVFGKIDENNKALKKLVEKEGTYAYNSKGDKVGEPTFTKDQAEQMKKLREETDKLHAALAKALEDGDFSKINELGK